MFKPISLSILCVLTLTLGGCNREGGVAPFGQPVSSQRTPASKDTWIEGKHYFVVDQLKPSSYPGKIEVSEVFSYGCLGCNQFREAAATIAAQLPTNVTMTFLPVSFNPAEDYPLFQRAYYTAQVLGVAAQAHDAMFDAVWKNRELAVTDKVTGAPKPAEAQPTLDDVARFYARYGIDPTRFVSTAHSAAVDAQMKHADVLSRSYGIEVLPSVIVAGKYRLDPVSAGGYPEMIRLTRWLVSRSVTEKQNM